MNKMDARQLKTQAKLHAAAIHIFSEKEGQPSIKEICSQAKITRPTFYNHYASVEELKVSLTNEILSDMKQALLVESKAPLKDFSPTEMPKIFTKLFSHIEDNLFFYETFLVKRRENTICDAIFNILKGYIISGMAIVDPAKPYVAPTDLIIQYVTGAYYQCIVSWIEQGRPYPAEEMYTNMLALSLYGPYGNLIPQIEKEF